MSETKKLIEFVQYLIYRETKADEHKCRKDVRLKYLEEIKSILEQQYQHEQNILNYGTDEPEEQQPQPDEETIEAINCKAGEENMEGEIRSGGRPKLDRMDLEQRAIAIGVFIPDDISDLRLESLVNFAEADQIFNEKMRKKP